jgi:hypothetical protein
MREYNFKEGYKMMQSTLKIVLMPLQKAKKSQNENMYEFKHLLSMFQKYEVDP